MQIAGYKLWPYESFRFRLFAAFSLVTLFISATFTAIYSYKEISSFKQRTDEKARILATELATAIRLPLFAEDIPTLERYAASTARYKGVNRVTILNGNDRVMAENGRKESRLPNDRLVYEVEVRPEPMEKGGEEMYGSMFSTDPVLGKVRVAMDDSELRSFVRSLLIMSLVILFFFWFALSCIGIVAIKRITQSLTPLSAGLDAMKGGDFSVRIPAEGRDEIAEAAAVINDLADKLEKREEENRHLQKELIDAMKNEVREERRRIMAKLIQTNRMTSLGLLVSSAAHEINTPNGAIRLAGQQIYRSWNDTVPILDRVADEEGDFALGGMEYSRARDQLGRSMDVIIRSSERIDRVVKDLKEYGAGDHGKQENKVSLNQVVADALSIIRAHGRHENVVIDNRAVADIPAVNGSRHQLEQVITNLLLNSVQSIPEERRGMVTVETGHDEAGGTVTVTVSDNGEGIPEDIRDQLFEPFFSTRIERGGSGLGLYISNFIIKDHAGSLTFESNPGKGTAFTIRLPAAG